MSLATPLLKGVGKPEREIGEASDPIDGEIPPPHDTGWAFQCRPLLFLVVSDRSFLLAHPKRLKVLVTQSAS